MVFKMGLTVLKLTQKGAQQVLTGKGDISALAAQQFTRRMEMESSKYQSSEVTWLVHASLRMFDSPPEAYYQERQLRDSCIAALALVSSPTLSCRVLLSPSP